MTPLLAGLALLACGQQDNPDNTQCFGNFSTQPSASRASKSVRNSGFDASTFKERKRWYVTFHSDGTGEEARQFRQLSRRVIAREGGVDGGCLEKPDDD